MMRRVCRQEVLNPIDVGQIDRFKVVLAVRVPSQFESVILHTFCVLISDYLVFGQSGIVS